MSQKKSETALIQEGAKLIWHCDECGPEGDEPAQPEYALGDWEPCGLCDGGTARVIENDSLGKRKGKR